MYWKQCEKFVKPFNIKVSWGNRNLMLKLKEISKQKF